MKIAVDITASIYQGTGVATYYNNLVPELMKLRGDIDFIFFGYALRKRDRLKLATKVFPFPPTLMEILWNKLHIIPVEKLVGNCDIYHAWDYIHAPVKKAKYLTTIHDITPILFPDYHHPKTVSTYKNALGWVKKMKAEVITDSKTSKRDLVKHLGLSKNRVHVIYLAAQRKFHDFNNKTDSNKKLAIEQVKSRYKISGEYILSVGTNEPRKNLQKLVEAYQLLDMNLDLVITGNIGWGKQIQSISKIKNIGLVQENELPALYAGASCFVYPSLYEGFGLPVLEAMTVGCPVVTTKKGSLEEVAGAAAVFVDPEKKEAIVSGIHIALHEKEKLSKTLPNRNIETKKKNCCFLSEK